MVCSGHQRQNAARSRVTHQPPPLLCGLWHNPTAQLLPLLGSADTLGNVGSLYRHLRTGITDVVSIPASKALDSPADIVGGIAGGVGSLASNTVSGVVGTIGGIMGAVNRGVSYMSLDKKVAQEHVRRDRWCLLVRDTLVHALLRTWRLFP